MILQELTSINGVSGNEWEVSQFIKNRIENYCDEIIVDNIGNLIAVKRCKNKKISNPKRVMLAAHMDEVGFMLSSILPSGLIKFVQVGGVDDRIIPGKELLVGKNKIPGIVLTMNPTAKVPSMNDLYLDIGASSQEMAFKYLSLGDYIAFKSDFVQLSDNTVKAKAFDDRVGCAILMEILQENHDFDLYACFTVQEEIGLRGAEVAAYRVNPDFALVIEGTTCSDLSNVIPTDFSTILGAGPAVSIMDRPTYYDRDFREWVEKTAQKNNVKYQIKNTFTGGNDSARIQRSGKGVKVLVISVPVRYIHSPSSVMNLSDYENMKLLIRTVLSEIKSYERSI